MSMIACITVNIATIVTPNGLSLFNSYPRIPVNIATINGFCTVIFYKKILFLILIFPYFIQNRL